MTNVIQFPGKGKVTEPSTPKSKTPPTPPKVKAQQKVLAGTVLAIILATVATNRIVYSQSSTDFSSHGGRSIASVDSVTARDASWEKSVAESLASAEVRGPASFNIGREVTAEEQLQLGALQGVYTLQFSEEGHQLRAITLQGSESKPTYLSPDQFFKKYGRLIDARFKQAVSLRAPLQVNGRVNESFQVLDVDNRPVGEAHFEMDRHGRLLSLQVSTPNHL